MKRYFLHFIFLVFVSSGVFAGNQLVKPDTLQREYDPLNPFTTYVDTCVPVAGDTMIVTIVTSDVLCNGDATGAATITVNLGTAPYTYLWSNGQTTTNATGYTAGTKNVEVWDSGGLDCVFFFTISEPGALVVNMTPAPSNPSCFGTCDGVATAAPVGGVSPYTYSWSNGQTTAQATGLCNGTHTVTVTDANACIKIKTVTLTQPAPLVSGGSTTTITCFGLCNGSASVTPAGGTAPYTYSWAPGGATTSSISGLCVNNYTCTIVDSKSCTVTYVAAVTQPTALGVTLTSANLLCNGVCTGSVTATASGGTPGYTYSWAPGGATTSSVTGLCANTYTLTLTDANGCTLTNTVSITEPSGLSTSPGVNDITCFGMCDGSVSANPSGGTPPYTYSWLPGGCATDTCINLCAGTYTSTVTDANGCTITTTVTVTEPPDLVLTPTKTDAVCPGVCNGTADANASGGTAPYTYSWSTIPVQTTSTITGLCAGTYTIIVIDANGCQDTSNITINMPLPLLPNASVTNNVSCFGLCDGAVTSAPTGGTSPYTYDWDTGNYTTQSVSGLCAGTYTLSLLDANGCPASQTVTITQPGSFSVSIASATPNPLNCNGDCNGTAVASVSGGTAPYSYSWNTGPTTASITGLCAGVYSVTATDANGCTSATSVTFVQPTTLSVTITSSDPSCNGSCDGSIGAIAGGGTPGYTYNWLPGGQTTAGIAGLCAGGYTLTVTDSKGCTDTKIDTLVAPSILSNSITATDVTCAGSCDGTISVVPSGGTSPYSFLWSPGGQTTSSVSGLCTGTYSVTVTDANNCTVIDVITIVQPLVLTSSISSTTSSCTICNGSATVSTSGGTLPYTFLWCDGQTTSTAVGLCIGTCSVTVTDANGCTNTLTATINPVVVISITVSGSSVSCAGACDGISTVNPTGGVAPYTYLWSPGGQTTSSATGLCAGTYTVCVADINGCISCDTVVFTDPPVLTSSIASTTASCGACNGTATSTPSGGTGGYTYTWSSFPVQTTATATGLCPGNYSVTVNDANNCTTTNTVTVGNIPVISDNPSTTLANCGMSDGAICVAPSGGVPPYTYQWSPGGETTACVTGIPAGIDTVIISDAAGCSDTFAIAVSNIAGPTISVLTSVDPTCNGDCDGSISISSSGGTTPYTYLWNPGGQTDTAISSLCAGIYILQNIDAATCTTFVSDTLIDPSPISPNPVITNATCNGGNDGSICLSPSGGTSPYTYTWLPGMATTSCLSGLASGTYSVVIADVSGCDDTISISVGEPALLSVTLSSTDVNCNGNCDGTITATVTGGTPLYTYAWSNGGVLPSIIGLCPNTYSVLVTDNVGCTDTASVLISEPTILTTTLTSTNASCNGSCDGTATISASGGTTAYTYSWLPGGETTSAITGLCAGNYFGTVTDANGCVSTQSVTISDPAVLSVTVSTTSVSCNGGCDGTASSSVTGGTGMYTYLWNPGGFTSSSITGLCAGSYTLGVTDANGCVVNNIFSISEPAVLQANITNTPPSCFGGCDGTASSSPIGGTGAYTFLWSNGQTTSTATGLCAGTHTLTLSDANGCSITQTTLLVSPSQITIASGVAGATCLVCNGSITVVASGGTPAYSYLWNTGDTTPSITALCAGLYTVTVTDANLCTRSDTISLSNTSGPTLVTSFTNVTCAGACNGTASVVATGDGPAWVYSWNTTPVSTTQSVSNLCPNQYFIGVTDTNGCVTFDTANITEPAPLALNQIITNATCFGICDGDITLNPSGGTGAYTFAWLPGGQTTSSISAQCAGNYSITLTDANNCALSTTITIGQNTIITATVTSTNNSCNASCDGTAAVSGSGGTLPYTYAWAPTGQTTSSVTGLCVGTHTLTITDAIGCQHIDSAVITEPAVLAANAVGINPLCNGDCNGSITASPTGGTAPYTYLWSTTATISSISGLCANSYTVTVTDANNCSDTDVIVLGDPVILSSTNIVTNASCTYSSDGSIDLTPAGGTGAYTFNWQPGGGATEDTVNLSAGVYTVTITDANGCTLDSTITVGVTTVVISNAGNDTSYCSGGSANLCSSSINATSVTWYQLPAWTSIGITNCVNVTPPVGSTSYGLIAVNGVCSDTDTVVVTVNPVPTVFAGNDTAGCAGDTISICGSGTSTSYAWYQLPGWTLVGNTQCVGVSPAAGTTDFAVVGLLGTCSDTDTVSVTIDSIPVSLAGNDTSFCLGGTATLCSGSINAASIEWYQLPSWTFVNNTNCISTTPVAGVYTFALIATNGVCSDTDTVSVTVNAFPVVFAGNDTASCSGDSLSLCASGANVYLWYQLPAWTPVDTAACIMTSPPVGTTCFTVIGMNGVCSDTDTVCVTVIQMPTAIAPNDTTYCQNNDSITLCSSSINTASVSWYNISSWTLIDTTACVTVVPSVGINDYGLIATNGICSDTDTVVVTINASPAVNAGTSVTILSTSTTVLSGSGGGTFTWIPSTGLSDTSIANPVANPSVTTTYTLIVTDLNGCTASDTVRVEVVQDVIVNDGLSPNGDGINDIWEIPNIEQFPKALVEVYNRWGELLISTTDYKNNKWNGKYNGNDLPVGTYYYVINLNSDLYPDPITGPITIMR